MEQLIEGARALQIRLTPEHLEALRIYQQMLVEFNRHFNLTAITDDEGIQIRHFLDSLSCFQALESGERFSGKAVIDVGTGAGFPGLPLKLLCPAMKLTLLEATAKKVSFLEQVTARLGLTDVVIVHGRAEELGQQPAHRERYDWAIARAVADMPILAEYLLPLVKVGGRVLAQKGEGAPAEVQRSEWAIQQLGGRVRRLVPVELRGLAETRYLVILDKVAATPPPYPRRPGIPNKRPLMPKAA
ncbi:MAG TPA: 16S rRNA (guanine(527)-N(7))-methyltransferase RsmG [Anaerolineae bacterium]|nr:16S rRNA (guanine(527)-N(7))-methyltransferase RsmG [Anaerolineae bacterium]HQK13837.1 16S rRNA (guanine(527)-N(7))-methyltransferase RsmG [Anaerolineae bacterium]